MTFTGASVENKVVIVSGGGTGIGAAVAHRYASEGARVAILGRRGGPLEAVAEQTGVLPVVVDVADTAQTRAAIAAIVDTLGSIDVLVANAGGHGFAAVGEMSDLDWDASLRANLTSAFVLTRGALPHLIESRGSVVIVSSLAGLLAGPSAAGYTVGKHALIGLTRSLARDYGKNGVRVNAVCPGWVRTPMADEEMDEFARHAGFSGRDEGYARVTADVPLGRAAEAAEIASIVRFLGSAESSIVTGAVIVADGGAHIVDLPTLAFEHAGM